MLSETLVVMLDTLNWQTFFDCLTEEKLCYKIMKLQEAMENFVFPDEISDKIDNNY